MHAFKKNRKRTEIYRLFPYPSFFFTFFYLLTSPLLPQPSHTLLSTCLVHPSIWHTFVISLLFKQKNCLSFFIHLQLRPERNPHLPNPHPPLAAANVSKISVSFIMITLRQSETSCSVREGLDTAALRYRSHCFLI